MCSLRDKYDYLILFPGVVGYLLGTKLHRAGKTVLIIAETNPSHIDIPRLHSRAIYFPDVFKDDLEFFGLDVPEISGKIQYSVQMGDVEFKVEPDGVRQLAALVKVFPDLDGKLLNLLPALDDRSHKLYQKLAKDYREAPGKRELARNFRIARGKRSFLEQKLSASPRDHSSDLAQLALVLPGYLSFGKVGVGSDANTVAAIYGMRCPRFADISPSELRTAAEHMYHNDGGDWRDVASTDQIILSGDASDTGNLSMGDLETRYRRIFLSRDNAARLLAGSNDLHSDLQGLTLVGTSYEWTPAGRVEPMDNILITDPGRPPVNDNFIAYETTRCGDSCYVISTFTVERGESVQPNYDEKRSLYIRARAMSNLATHLGGKVVPKDGGQDGALPQVGITGEMRFMFYDDNFAPGQTLEDLPRIARYLVEHA